MKLILSIIQAADEADTVQELNRNGYFVTKLSTTGGFLKAKNTTLLIGTDNEKVDGAIEILKKIGCIIVMTGSCQIGTIQENHIHGVVSQLMLMIA